ncbi:MAG: formylglycine-generating enzyme family protein [Cytophagales bacterium]|jgi:formylglycine-generating enzyme required for sulfatase activity|nr:formylglycine-generating enzyme family protein [Cytophagales bacterium]
MIKKISKRFLVLFACCSSFYGLTSLKRNNFDSIKPSFKGLRRTDLGNIKRDRGSERRGRKKEESNPIPPGMVKVHGGIFTIGRACKDIFRNPFPYRKVTVSNFFMDKTEVTNAEYRKYIAILKDKFLEWQNMNANEMSKIKINSSNISYYRLLISLGKNLTEKYIKGAIPNMALFKRDFSNSMADSYAENYFNSPDFDNYPVVCVTQENAIDFTKWTSLFLNEFCVEHDKDPYPNFCLPSWTQWMYAANGGIEWCNVYSWGGMGVRDENGCLRQNFKAANGDYCDNGRGTASISPVDEYEPNNFGLFDMGGNVKEWVADAYSLGYYNSCVPLDPVNLDPENPLKMVVGGSFHSPARELQIGNFDTEHKDHARGDLGFRRAMSCP